MPVLATNAAAGQYGIKSGHAEILQDTGATDAVLELMSRVKSYFPEEHLHYFSLGGFDVELDSSYSELEKRMILKFGFYVRALANGKLEPTPVNRPFLEAVQKNTESTHDVANAWLKFRKDYPKLARIRDSDE